MNKLVRITLATVAMSVAGATIGLKPAAAEPPVSATAAAVNIKFQDAGTTNGSLSSAGNSGSVNTNVNGVKEISAAIATGETKAVASINNSVVNAEGSSQPVILKFNTFNRVTTGTSVTDAGTVFDYTGSTAGLSYIPTIK